MTVDVEQIKQALMDVVPMVNGEKEEFQKALQEVLVELNDNPVDLIRSAAYVVPRQSSRYKSQRAQRRATPLKEIDRQIDVLVDFVQHEGCCEVGDAVYYLVDNCPAIAVKPNPRSTAVGRINGAVSRGLIAWSGNSFDKKGRPYAKMSDLLEVATATTQTGGNNGR
jgi:hypothetical protein